MKTNKKVVVNDKMQQNYEYELVEPQGKNYRPDFKPDLTPKQMLGLGVFGGVYMRDCREEFPAEWFNNANFAPGDTKKHVAEINYFKINASQPLRVWREKGWIHPDDPRGWFQWYCRYYMGRRHEDDERQIKRWKAFKRHWSAVEKNCLQGDYGCRRKQRQALLHWAYNSRKI